MSDLISRSEAIEALDQHSYENGSDYAKTVELLNELPAVDAAPVAHARWIDPCINKYGHPCHHCSACGFKASQKDRNFCPNCGARMDGETECVKT